MEIKITSYWNIPKDLITDAITKETKGYFVQKHDQEKMSDEYLLSKDISGIEEYYSLPIDAIEDKNTGKKFIGIIVNGSASEITIGLSAELIKKLQKQGITNIKSLQLSMEKNTITDITSGEFGKIFSFLCSTVKMLS